MKTPNEVVQLSDKDASESSTLESCSEHVHGRLGVPEKQLSVADEEKLRRPCSLSHISAHAQKHNVVQQ